MTTILIKKKDTAGAPAPGDLTNAAGGTEIAVNTATKRIYTKDSGGNVVELGTNASASTIDQLTVTTSATLSYGTANGVAYLNGSKVLTTGSALTFDGSDVLQLTATNNAVVNLIGSITNNAIFRLQNATTGNLAGIYANNSKQLIFEANGTAEQMRLTSTGLGIGTSSPLEKLTVNGAIAVTGGITGHGANRTTLSQEGANGAFWQSYGANTSTIGSFKFRQASSDFSLNRVAMEIDSSGNLGLGVTPSAWGQSGTLQAIQIKNTAFAGSGANAYWGSNWYGGGFDRYITTAAASLAVQTGGQHIWYNAPSGTAGNAISFTQAMTLDASGNLLVGGTSGGAGNSFTVNTNSGGGLYTQTAHPNGTGSGVAYAIFYYNGSNIGSITQSGTTAVLFNITSDQRLKENIQNAASASSLIDAIQVRQYDWKSDGSHQRYGFIAQELVAVAPEAVHQPADPEEMMAVDYSKLVPMLVKEIQSLRQRLAAAGI